VTILNYFLTKFLGDERAMNSAKKVEVRLVEVYKRSKALRLVTFWLYVRNFGTEQAKASFGKDSFYRSRRELGKAGISLLGPPRTALGSNITFLEDFRLDVPSPFATNVLDDYRDSENVLNLPKGDKNKQA
jgi:hypothetical protein